MITLKAGEIRPFPLTGKFLICRKSATGFFISAPDFGVRDTALATADVAELDKVPRINLLNKSLVGITIDVQSSAFRIEPSADGNVTVGNNIVVQRVVEQQAFAATIQNSNKNTHLPQVTCAPGVATLLAAANIKRKELRLSIDSLQAGGIFIGGLGIVANQGGFVDVGMVDYVSTEGALYAFNPNATAVNVSVLSLERV